MSAKRLLVVSIVLVLAFTSIAASPAAVTSRFAGVWTGTGIQVRITNFNNVSFVDQSWAACGGGKVKGTGHGVVNSTNKNVLVASLRLKCAGTGIVVARNYTIRFTVQPSARRLTDSLGGVYVLTQTIC